MLALEVEGARKSYREILAINDLSFSLAPGCFAALLGRNGAGKTTLFQLLSGLFAADAGYIRVLGHDIAIDPCAALACLGLVFQQPALDLDLSAYANLRFHARLHGLPSGEASNRIRDAVSRFGIERASLPCRQLSGGNRRRVELARALLHRPSLLLMDEPTVGLDPVARRQLLADVQGLCRSQGLSVLWATHLVDEAAQADHILLLHRGELRAQGDEAAICAQASSVGLEAAFSRLTAAEEHAPTCV